MASMRRKLGVPYLVVATLIAALGIVEGPDPTYAVVVSWLTVYLATVLFPVLMHWELIKFDLPDRIVLSPLLLGLMALGASLHMARIAGS